MGLAIAVFLVVSGATGAVISWDHELDSLLNPHLVQAGSHGPPIPSLQLARQVERDDPRVRVTYLPLAAEPGKSLALSVEPRVDVGTGRLFEPGYNQIFLDPVTGRELGRREWGAAWPITRENFVPFLYKLHYSLHLPEMWGIDRWGLWLMGTVAGVWTIDCFIGFYLTLPAGSLRRGWWSRWRPAWRIKTSSSAWRANFDIHRACGLWAWGLLVVLAFTGFSLGLYREVFYPLMSMVSPVTPSPFDLRSPAPRHRPFDPKVGLAEIVDRTREEAARRGWREPLGAVFYRPAYDIYGATFFDPGEDHGTAGLGPARLYFDGGDGRLLGDRQPWDGTAADIFMQAQFPLHSGRILGLPGRILVSLAGLVVAALSVTGIVIWYGKRRARMSPLRAGR